MKRQLKHIHDETVKYYALMALVPDTFGRLQDKTKAQVKSYGHRLLVKRKLMLPKILSFE
jgi:hypothetical protein